MRPGQEIRLVKENLAFALAIWKAASTGRLPPEAFHQQQWSSDSGVGEPDRSLRELSAQLTRDAGNQMRAAFALSVLQARRSLAVAFPGEPIEEELPELRTALSVIHLIALAVQRSVIQPVWECPPPYRRFFHIRRLGLTLNATGLGGKALSWDDFGGLEAYLDLLEYCAASADVVPEEGYGSAPVILPFHLSRLDASGVIGMPQDIDPPTEALPMRPPSGYTENGKPRYPAVEQAEARPESTPAADVGSTAKPSPVMTLDRRQDLVDRFLEEQCETGADRRILAGELYADFVSWCNMKESDTISQRSFGLRLRALGLTRKRRGHGKHWWMGIGLAENPTTPLGRESVVS